MDLLDAEEGFTHRYLAAELEPLSRVRVRTRARLQTVQETLELELDHLTDNVHKLEQCVRVAEWQANAVLRRAADRLKRREGMARKSAGTGKMPMKKF